MSTPLDEFDLDVRLGVPGSVEMVGDRRPPTSEPAFGTCEVSCTHYSMCCPTGTGIC